MNRVISQKKSHYYKHSLALSIILITYGTLLNNFLPKIDLGAGIPDIDFRRGVICLLLFVFSFELHRYRRLKMNNLWYWFTAVYMIVVALSPLWSAHVAYNVCLFQNLLDMYFIPFACAVIFANVFLEEFARKIYFKHSAIALSLVGLSVILQVLFFPPGVDADFRSQGLFNNPNLTAIIIVLLLPNLFFCREMKLLPKYFLLTTEILAIIAVFATISKKGVGTMFLCYCIYLFCKKRYKILLFVTAIMVVVSFTALQFPQVQQRITANELEDQFHSKKVMRDAGVKMFKERPLLGYGYEGYFYNYGKYIQMKVWRDNYDAHNEYVTALANYGITGFVPFFMMLFYPAVFAWKIYRKPGSKQTENDIAILTFCVVIPFMVSAFFAGTLMRNIIAIYPFFAQVSLIIGTSFLRQKVVAKRMIK